MFVGLVWIRLVLVGLAFGIWCFLVVFCFFAGLGLGWFLVVGRFPYFWFWVGFGLRLGFDRLGLVRVSLG